MVSVTDDRPTDDDGQADLLRRRRSTASLLLDPALSPPAPSAGVRPARPKRRRAGTLAVNRRLLMLLTSDRQAAAS